MPYRFKEARLKAGLTTVQLAQKMGVTRMSLVKTLSGNPSYETLQRIAEALGVEMWELFASKEEIVNKDKNVIYCPKCGARFELKED